MTLAQESAAGQLRPRGASSEGEGGGVATRGENRLSPFGHKPCTACLGRSARIATNDQLSAESAQEVVAEKQRAGRESAERASRKGVRVESRRVVGSGVVGRPRVLHRCG